MPKQFPFSSEQRIRKADDFQRVYSKQCGAGNGVIRVLTAKNEFGYTRLGLSVSRRVGNACVRNRWKRVLREAFRLTAPDLPQGFDFVIIPRGGTKPDFQALTRALPKLARLAVKRLKDRDGRPAPSRKRKRN